MVKNKLEKQFSKMLKEHDLLWGIKLQVNPLAHTVSPADYIVSSLVTEKLSLVECKLVTCGDKSSPRLTFKRLKQMSALLQFSNLSDKHISYFCIAFWKGRWTKSDLYLIRAEILAAYINSTPSKSINVHIMEETFRYYKITNLTRLE